MIKINIFYTLNINYFHTVNFPFSNIKQSTGHAIDDLSNGNNSSKSLSES